MNRIIDLVQTDKMILPVFFTAAGIILFILIAAKLFSVFYRKLQQFFETNAYLDDAVRKKLFRLALFLAIMLPASLFFTAVWISVIRRDGILFGINVSNTAGVFFLTSQILLLWGVVSTLSFFGHCYQQNGNNIRRPIHAILLVCYTLLCIWGITCVGSMLLKVRPLVMLSTLGAIAAFFIFAFQNLISSLLANLRINAEKIVKVGDWIVMDEQKIDGIVETISAHTIQVRNWDMSLVSCPIRLLLDETLVNYEKMIDSKARRIKRSIPIDQRSIRILRPEEIADLQSKHLIDDEMLKHADLFDAVEDASGCRAWTNLELFTLYAESYLRKRPDIRHDMKCIIRCLEPSPSGLPLEVYCYSVKSLFMEFEPVQRAVLFHLLAVLPSFRLCVFQRSSDLK